jgi:hypothetical protein
MQFVRATEKIFKDESRNKKMNEKEIIVEICNSEMVGFLSQYCLN